MIGSFAASIGTSNRSSSRSTDRLSYILRAVRDIDSQITTSNRRSGRFASSSRSAIPPSRAIGTSNRS
ncbi:hypothetical protein A4R43_14915 [Amycolatopsis albispora]|uniref:Uncharacterized protein n=1 Tax=Amycolatopsis albispora TaxID=1804986 RepID=A0A344L6J6_9PSEU|nr:hypothetical protein A4R43_14915 [Amycolatopsis albispora]